MITTHIVAASGSAGALHDLGHFLAVLWHWVVKYAKFVLVAVILVLQIFRVGVHWLQAVILLVLGAMIPLIFSARILTATTKITQGHTVSTTGATIGELITLLVLAGLTLFMTFASKG